MNIPTDWSVVDEPNLCWTKQDVDVATEAQWLLGVSSLRARSGLVEAGQLNWPGWSKPTVARVHLSNAGKSVRRGATRAPSGQWCCRFHVAVPIKPNGRWVHHINYTNPSSWHHIIIIHPLMYDRWSPSLINENLLDLLCSISIFRGQWWTHGLIRAALVGFLYGIIS